ncbi:hypothetical protein pipiens_006883 [Culex pipiens pipiens]|uniref:Uncharacterized protein n=1 Tax=Culex pipiens pipiens TaxID=38569 RepID=A0ABD1DNW6_CULPP
MNSKSAAEATGDHSLNGSSYFPGSFKSKCTCSVLQTTLLRIWNNDMDSVANAEGEVPATAPEVSNDPLLEDYVVIPDDSSVHFEDGEESQEEEGDIPTNRVKGK